MLGGGEHEAQVSKRWASAEGRSSWLKIFKMWACMCLICFGDLHLPIMSMQMAHMAH